MPARSPALKLVTPAPTASTTPTASCPMIRGSLGSRHSPDAKCRSVWQTPQALTLMRISPGPGCGSATSSTTSGAPGLWSTAAFMRFGYQISDSAATARHDTLLLGNRHLGKDNGEGVQRHRLDQHQGKDEQELDSWASPRVAPQALTRSRSRPGLRIATARRRNRHGKSGSDGDPLDGLGSRSTCRGLPKNRYRHQQTRYHEQEHQDATLHLFLLEVRPPRQSNPYEFPPGGGSPT